MRTEEMDLSDIHAVEAAGAREKEERLRELVTRIRSGDLAAFEELLRLYERRVLGTALQMGLGPADAQDACQEVFLRVFRYLSGFRIHLSFERWFWRIVVNVVYDSLRRRRDRGEVPWDGVTGGEEGLPGSAGGLQIGLENADLCRKLLLRMETLTAKERIVFVLRDLQEMDTAEISRALGISKVTVRRHGSSARRKLREALAELSEKSEKDAGKA